MDPNALLGLYLLNKNIQKRKREKEEEMKWFRNKTDQISTEEDSETSPPCDCNCQWHRDHATLYPGEKMLNYKLFKYIELVTDAIYKAMPKETQKKITKAYEEFGVDDAREQLLSQISVEIEDSLFTCEEETWTSAFKKEYWKARTEIDEEFDEEEQNIADTGIDVLKK